MDRPAWKIPFSLDSAFLLCVIGGPFLNIAVNRIVDGARLVYDANGVATALGGGGRATQLSTLLTGAITCAIALTIIIRGVRTRRGGLTWAGLLVSLAAGIALVRDPARVALDGTIGAIALLAAGFLRVDRKVLSTYGRFAIFAALANFFYAAVIAPSVAWEPCRPDKCTLAGGLFQGMFWGENGVALYFVTLLPTLAFITSARWRRLGLLLCLASIYLSGSRGGYVATIMAVMAYLTLSRVLNSAPADQAETLWARGEPPFQRLRPFVRVLATAPLVGTIISAGLFALLPPSGLTERGSVYAALRAVISQNWFFGTGIERVQQEYYNGHADFLMANEHGQFTYVLNRAGAIGLLVFFLALFVLWRRSNTWLGATIALLFVGPAVFFPSESQMPFGYGYGWPLLPMLAVVGALPPAPSLPWRPLARWPRQAPAHGRVALARGLRRGWRPAVGLIVLGVVGGAALFAVNPRTYLATATRMALPPVSTLSQWATSSTGPTMVSGLLAVADSPEVRWAGGQAAGLDKALPEGSLHVEGNNALLVQISYSSDTPGRAVAVADAAGDAATERRDPSGDDGGTFATLPTTVSSSGMGLAEAMGLGAAAGLLAATLLLMGSTGAAWLGLQSPRRSS